MTPITDNKAERLRINKGEIYINIFVHTGKDGDYFIMFSPTLNVSGYGNNEKEAEESFLLNLKLFAEDIFSLSGNQREMYIYSLGFKKEPHSQKTFSHLYVDNDGKLCGFEDVSQHSVRKFNKLIPA